MEEPIVCGCRYPALKSGRVHTQHGSDATGSHLELASGTCAAHISLSSLSAVQASSRTHPLCVLRPNKRLPLSSAVTRPQPFRHFLSSRTHCLVPRPTDRGRRLQKKERNVAEPLACECRDPAPEPGRVSDSTAPMRPNCSSKTHPELPPNAYYSPRVRPFKSFPQDVFCASEVPVLLTVPFPSPRAASVRAPGGEKQNSVSGRPRRQGGSCDE